MVEVKFEVNNPVALVVICDILFSTNLNQVLKMNPGLRDNLTLITATSFCSNVLAFTLIFLASSWRMYLLLQKWAEQKGGTPAEPKVMDAGANGAEVLTSQLNGLPTRGRARSFPACASANENLLWSED